MTNRISAALLSATALAAALTVPATAQTSPVVATITVPVSISNLDTEFARRIGTLAVRCDVFEVASAPERRGSPSATGIVIVPLQEKAATTTVRATMSYSGSITVPTYVAAAPVGPDVRDDPETRAQRLAADAIKRAQSYGCWFVNPSKPGDDISLALATGAGQKADSTSKYFVSGTFPAH